MTERGMSGRIMNGPIGPRLRSGVATALLIWSGVVLGWLTVPGRAGLDADPARVLVVGGYLLATPGCALVLVLGLRDRLLSVVVALTFSWAALVLFAQAALYSGHWSPPGVAVALVVLTIVLCLWTLTRDLRAWRAGRLGARSAT